ncbi:Predicted PurR-regulated permease PerM [Fictibacillus solisalsi]|uniref:Predicted PurR-regulated permease PerM n=1 Tax=Fictibacillus solisalsi TaxID=459525 RepID=A0A1G9U508_9BACL|nr:AI-2E family transporter [Fictibacillus solisalsi]SDM54675.1 Predicted PurR-regulated permease PerM [Fictibacillus solisalsi]
MPNSKYFRIGYGIIIILIIIFLSTKVSFIFRPLEIIFTTLFFPFLIGGVIFYLLRPIVYYLGKHRVPKALSILLIYLLFIGLGTLLVFLLGPQLQNQFQGLIKNTPQIVDALNDKINGLKQNEWFSRFQQNEYLTLDSITKKASDYAKDFANNLGDKITSLIGIITSIATVIVTVPFIVFYMLKDSEGLGSRVENVLPYLQASEAKRILKDMDEALSSYIQGQAIAAFLVGVMMYIGYSIIGLDYSLILAITAMITNIIPFLGAFIAFIPAIIIGLIMSPFMALKVAIVVIVVQQIDGNVTSPLIMGRKLDVHPLTVILILLVAGNMAGFLGMILGVPFYALLKVIVSHTYRLYQLNREKEHNGIKIVD